MIESMNVKLAKFKKKILLDYSIDKQKKLCSIGERFRLFNYKLH